MSGARSGQVLDAWRAAAFQKRSELAWPAKLGLAFLMAGITGLAAQVRFPVPGTVVPVTGQVFAVLLSGVLLGGAWGAISQVLYVGLGAAGLPWFSGMAGGVPLGPTAGYLLGFIMAAALIGWVTDRFPMARRFSLQLILMLGGVLVIYAFGAGVYSVSMGTDVAATLAQAVFPFIAVDFGKAVAAAAVAKALLPKAPTKAGGKKEPAQTV